MSLEREGTKREAAKCTKKLKTLFYKDSDKVVCGLALLKGREEEK